MPIHTDIQTDETKYITVPHLRVVQFLLQSTLLSSNRMSMSYTNNKTFTISDSHKDEIKLITHGNHMVTTWSVISMAAHTNLHCQLECKLLQNISLDSLPDRIQFTEAYKLNNIK